MNSIVIANWKGSANLNDLENILKYQNFKNMQYIIAPNVIFIRESIINSQNKNIDISAQKFDLNGNLTGETSLSLIKNIGCKYVLCNHFDHINNNYNSQKCIQEIEKHDLIPIIFVKNYCEAESLSKISKSGIIVFEPHEYIGKSDSMDPKKVEIEIKKIKSITKKPVCYGGSLNENNYKQFLYFADGLCFGRLSRSNDFISILQNISEYEV